MTHLPAGTVTFLFSDVEGSTRLLKLLRGRYADVLARHQRILRDAFAAHGGHEIDTQGDSFFVAFRRANDAVAAAVDAQRALAAEPWPDGVAVAVRIGIHTGEAAVAGERYVGVAVHRAARIGAAAHGGQILVSQITHDLLHDEEADLGDVRIVDLGEHRFKDLDRPARLFQVLAPGADGEFPPPRTAAPPAAADVDERGRPRRLFVVGGVVAAAATAALAVALLAEGRGADAGISAAPRSLVAIDPETRERVAGADLGQRARVTRLVSDGLGSLWALSSDEERVYRLDSRSGTVQEFFPTGDEPADVAAGARFLWIGHRDGLSLTRVDRRRELAPRTIRLGLERESTTEPRLVLAGEAIWMTHTLDDRHPSLVRVDARTLGTSVIALPTDAPAGDNAGDVDVGGGAVWVSGDSLVWAVNTATRQTESIRIPQRESTGPIGWGDEALYVADGETAVGPSLDTSFLWIASPSAGSVVGRATVPAQTRALAVGYGRAWVAHAGAEPSISSVFAEEPPRVDETIRLEREPLDVAAAGGLLWVSVD